MPASNLPAIVRFSAIGAFACLLLILPNSLRAEVRLPAIFSDHLVLMKAQVVPVWGKADAGEKIRVSVGAASAETVADAAGRWKAALNLKDSAQGPFEMIVEGKNQIVIHDVRYGWADNPMCNLSNSAGLPASPFRTDDFHVTTQDVRF